MAKKHFIYKITNMTNGKIYIGKTSHIKKRWANHIKRSETFDTHLYNSMRKYGIENFCMEIIEEVSKSRVDEIEKYWIARLNTTDRNIGYNIHIGGTGGDTFTYRTDTEKDIYRKKHSEIGKSRVLNCTHNCVCGSGNLNRKWNGYWNVQYPSGKIQQFITRAQVKDYLHISTSMVERHLNKNTTPSSGKFVGYKFFRSNKKY